MSDLPEFVLDRTFDAPRQLVWRAWTDPDLLQRWYGPDVETIIHEFDLKPGGSWLNEMKMSSGSNFQKVVFKEVTEPEKLVWHHFSTDADWNIIASPMMPDWPRVLLTTVNFADMGEKTNVRFSQIPFEGTAAEITCFTSAMTGMAGGWGKGFEIMDDLLVELQTKGN